ncbi:DUF6599 family protein [Desulfatitalea tepidiphila]|uniref:DUF6599 family protein n=1 Tax=Desulfatitalea tepidiphila TaxID=1185843 RepID=UPI0006B67B06|nr:DUF6599 family protein [Desulfatitalea tepidiphila]
MPFGGIIHRSPAIDRAARHAPSRRERLLSLLLIGLICLIGMAVYAVHHRFDPGQWRARATDEAPSVSTAVSSTDGQPEVANLRPISAPERYDAATLSDKIDGKAELYLAAGFESLETVRFALVSPPGPWLERYVYTMASDTSAYAVYSQQRRAKAEPLDLTGDAYRSANGIFMAHGVFYVEMIASDASAAVMQAALGLARDFVDAHPVRGRAADERDLFPEEGRLSEKVTLTAANAFGFDRFDRVFSAPYRLGEHAATAFLSRRKSTDEAAVLAEAYGAFLLEYGGVAVPAPSDLPPMTIIEILDGFEIVFSRGDLIGGVHEATDLQVALALADRLYRNLGEGMGAR